MADHLYETLVELDFYQPFYCADQRVGQVVPAGTPVHLGELIVGTVHYEPGRIAHICSGPHTSWVRIANLGNEIRVIPGLELLAKAAV